MQEADVEQAQPGNRPRQLLLALILLVTAAVLVVIANLVLEAMALDAGSTLDPAFRVVVWYLLPALSLACFVLALLRRPGPADWLLGLAAVPLIGWLAVSQFMYRHDVGGNLLIEAVVFTWCALALVVLALSAAPASLARRRSLRLMALGIPVPLMAFLLLVTLVVDAGGG